MSKKVLSKLFLCWATFTAILGCVWPVGHEMNTLESLEEKRPHRCSLGLCLHSSWPTVLLQYSLSYLESLYWLPSGMFHTFFQKKVTFQFPIYYPFFSFSISNATKIIWMSMTSAARFPLVCGRNLCSTLSHLLRKSQWGISTQRSVSHFPKFWKSYALKPLGFIALWNVPISHDAKHFIYWTDLIVFFLQNNSDPRKHFHYLPHLHA